MFSPQENSSRKDFINLMLETNKQLKSGNIQEQQEDILEDNYDKNGFLKTDIKQITQQQPMTIEVSIIMFSNRSI